MSFQRKLLVVALASAMPWMSAHAQSAAELKSEIEVLKAQLQALTQKIEAMSAQSVPPELVQQVNRIEQKQELAADDQEKSGFKGLKINGTVEAAMSYDDLNKSHNFSSSAGAALGESAMIQFTKESQDGEGVDWTLRLLPGSTSNPVHEASISVPLNKENRIIGGLIPDFQGYEYVFSNANPTLGNQLISHNALFDLAGPTSYAGIGMSHTFGGGTYALKWVVGNIDPGTDAVVSGNAATSAGNSGVRTVGLAARGDWFINEYSYIGLSIASGSVNRNFTVAALDGGFTRGDWAFNAQISSGMQRNGAFNGDDSQWTGISGLVGFKVTPRLQLLARADYIENRKNGGGTYYTNSDTTLGIGAENIDAAGTQDLDPVTSLATTGANLTRLTLGTNYQINANTQWKVEYRLDQSTGYNFTDMDGIRQKSRNAFATSVVLSF